MTKSTTAPKPFKPNRTLRTDARTLATIRKRIEKNNAAFLKLTKAQQRVQIAKDVLEQLAIKKIVATSTYFELSAVKLNNQLDDAAEEGIDLSEVTSQVKCNVCGIGSLFVAALERTDNFKAKKLVGTDTYGDEKGVEVRYLKKWFDEEQLNEVEDYFELFRANCDVHGNRSDPRSPSPIRRQKYASKRLRMIMENIISNNGRFDPDKGAHASDPESVEPVRSTYEDYY